MVKQFLSAATLGIAALSFSTVSRAEDFPATPLQHGAPRDLPGEHLIPGAQIAVDTFNTVTQPILQPILAPGDAAPAAAVAPAAHHHRHHLAARHHAHPRHFAAARSHHKAA